MLPGDDRTNPTHITTPNYLATTAILTFLVTLLELKEIYPTLVKVDIYELDRVMKKALDKNRLKSIYDKTAGYYDFMHGYGTYHQDQRGRKFIVEHTVRPGDYILDAGGGTGSAGFMGLEKSGDNGRLVILDLSEKMLQQAALKSQQNNGTDRVEIVLGDMYEIPFPDDTFDVVLSAYSTCPLADPGLAVIEMLRVTKVDGRVGIAHSTLPKGKMAGKISQAFDALIGYFPGLSLGCRNIDLTATLKKMEGSIVEDRILGFIPWYFRCLVIQKQSKK